MVPCKICQAVLLILYSHMMTKFNKQIIKNYEFKGILVLWFLKNDTVSGLQLNNYYDDFVKGTKYKRIY